jgi:hypothetical protein
MSGELLLAAHCCGQCLTTSNRIVPGERAAEIVRGCRRDDIHFICHKGQAAGLIVHCRGVHDISPSRAYRFAVACGIPVVEVDPDTLRTARDVVDGREGEGG